MNGFLFVGAFFMMSGMATALAQQESAPGRVTVDNFVRAESHAAFGGLVKDGGFGKFFHNRNVTPIEHQPVIRQNRDTLYSGAVFDLNAGAVTISLPEAAKRFMSMQIINEDEYTLEVVYKPGPHTLSKEKIGTRYVFVAVRTLVNPEDPADLDAVHKLQDRITVKQTRPGVFEVPKWDPESQKQVREALLQLGATVPDSDRMFGSKGKVDPVRHLIGAATAWGGNPRTDAIYLNVVPERNDGKTIYRLRVKDVPVDAFWSVSVYNEKGFYEKNDLNAYTINSVTAKSGADHDIMVQFGGCDGKIPNCLPITKGWNYMVRLYKPRAEILSGKWQFPAATPAN